MLILARTIATTTATTTTSNDYGGGSIFSVFRRRTATRVCAADVWWRAYGLRGRRRRWRRRPRPRRRHDRLSPSGSRSTGVHATARTQSASGPAVIRIRAGFTPDDDRAAFVAGILIICFLHFVRSDNNCYSNLQQSLYITIVNGPRETSRQSELVLINDIEHRTTRRTRWERPSRR